MAYKLIIFDFDGTLANSFPWVLGILDELAEKFKATPLDHSQLDKIKNLPPAQILQMHHIPIWKLPAILKFTRTRMRSNSEGICAFDGVDTLLTALKERDIHLALVTTNTCDIVRRILGDDLYNLFLFFEDEISMFGKPAALNRIAKKSGFDKNEMLAIGDEIRDIVAANKVNIPFGAVTWGFSSIDAFLEHSPMYTFSNMQQIVETVDAAD